MALIASDRGGGLAPDLFSAGRIWVFAPEGALM